MATDNKRQQRRETRLLQKESTWLQKALFALQRAEETHERIADLREEEPEPYMISVEDETVELKALEDALDARVQDLSETVRERRQRMR